MAIAAVAVGAWEGPTSKAVWSQTRESGHAEMRGVDTHWQGCQGAKEGEQLRAKPSSPRELARGQSLRSFTSGSQPGAGRAVGAQGDASECANEMMGE